MTADQRYLERCLRAIGIMTEAQLRQIKDTRVAIGGLGLGGSVFINLVRLGFEKFHVADPDIYERSNINRQRAARETTVGCRKDDCLIQEARAINPDVEIRAFPQGVSTGNVAEFVAGAQWVVDAVDIFAMPEKIALNEEARRRGIPAVSCVSVGFGAAIVVFDQGTPSFRELSGLDPSAEYVQNIDRFLRFAMPEIPEYMREQVGKAATRSSHVPFLVSGVEMSASLVTMAICQRILGLGDRVLAPQGIYVNPLELRLERFTADWRARELPYAGKKRAA
jgi:molybdopterin-synthase adenylyltransferase